MCGNHGTTFREQAEIWLEQMKNRKRKPVAPSTLSTLESCLENWLNPNIGHTLLDNVKNLSLKNLGIKMVEGGLGESAIHSYTNVVKMVVASAVNTGFSSLSAAVRGCDLGRHLGLESKISLRTVPPLRSCKKRVGHSFTIFSRPKAVLEKLICAQRLQRC